MNKWLILCMLLLLAGCGTTSTSGTHQERDDDPYTQEDLDKETEGVYRPSDPGKDDDGVEKGERQKPVREDGSTVEKPAEPKKEPAPKVETPKKDEPKKDEGSTVETPEREESKKEEPKKEEPKPSSDRMDLVTAFISNVSRRMDALEETRLWKDFLKAKEKFDDSVDKALEKQKDGKGKDLEEAWANSIRDWYEVRYMYELLLHLNWKASKDFEPGVPLNLDELKVYSDAELGSADCAQTYAAHELAEPQMKEVRQFQTDVLKYDLVAGKVYIDPKQEKKWSSEKQKWQDATEGKFDDKDVKKYS